MRDITRLYQLEAEMRRGETLAAAGQIAIGLAHEIRNPLGAIRGTVQLLKRELADEARWGEYTDVLLKEVDRVNRIIEMLLDLGRPVALRPVPLNIHQLLERVALMSEGMAAERGVTIVRRYDPSMPPILADEDRILQVFHNLVRNAMEAMPRGGRLTLVTRLSMNPLFAKMDLGRGLRSMAEIQVTTRARASRRPPRQAVHPLLHHQGHRARPRARPLPPHRGGASGRHPDRERARERHSRLMLSPDRPVTACLTAAS